MNLPDYSDFIVFVDESGSPTMSPMDPNYPIFVLAFCVVHKGAYADLIQPAVSRFKFEFFGHDLTNLHSWDIRRAKGEFRILQNSDRRQRFVESLSNLMAEADFYTIAHITDKRLIENSAHWFTSSYQEAFSLGLAQVSLMLDKANEGNKLVHIIAEARGQLENKELQEHFSVISQDHTINGVPRFALKIVPKSVNSAGLQLADLCAYPIGRQYLDQSRRNRAFEVIKDKVSMIRFP